MIRALITATALAAASTAQAAEMTFYQLPQGAFPHDVAPAPDGRVWYTGAAQWLPRTLRSEDAEERGDTARAERRPARCRRRSRRRGLGHRRRPERDRARRCRHQGREALSAAEGICRSQPQHADYRQQRRGLVHRPERRLRPRRSQDRQGRRLGVAEGPRPLRHRRDARRATSGTPRSPAITSPRSTRRPAPRRSWSRPSQGSGRAASGRTPRASSG